MSFPDSNTSTSNSASGRPGGVDKLAADAAFGQRTVSPGFGTASLGTDTVGTSFENAGGASRVDLGLQSSTFGAVVPETKEVSKARQRFGIAASAVAAVAGNGNGNAVTPGAPPAGPSKREIRAMRHAFAFYDPTRTGQILVSDALLAANAVGARPPDSVVRPVFAAAGIQPHDLIAFSRFTHLIEMFRAEEERQNVQQAREAFHVFDRQRRGYILSNELFHVLRCLGITLSEEETDEFVRDSDENGDGKIDLDEFVSMMSRRY